MGTFILKRKTYTVYDETDSLKRMKDSDILAQQKKEAPGFGNVAQTAATGAVAGAGALGVAGTIKNAVNGGGFKGAWKGFKGGAGTGAILGGLGAGAYAMYKRSKQVEDNSFYNKRLDFAQKQARRREKIDWKNNMTQRDGYSY